MYRLWALSESLYARLLKESSYMEEYIGWGLLIGTYKAYSQVSVNRMALCVS